MNDTSLLATMTFMGVAMLVRYLVGAVA